MSHLWIAEAFTGRFGRHKAPRWVALWDRPGGMGVRRPPVEAFAKELEKTGEFFRTRVVKWVRA